MKTPPHSLLPTPLKTRGLYRASHSNQRHPYFLHCLNFPQGCDFLFRH
ncbi:hypothetical protein PSAB6_250182 [Paraburkholderia sabiae]|nr:hypothetical protein PSAB6_250182 [Paraburkholderia sabiae]